MASVLELLKHHQHIIETHAHHEDIVLNSIEILYNLDVTVQHLIETGIGRTINAFRSQPGDVGAASRALVYKWKIIVVQNSLQNMDDTSDYSDDSAFSDSDDTSDLRNG